MDAKTDFGLFKSYIPGLDSEDMRSSSAITIEFWVKFGKMVPDRNILSIANIAFDGSILDQEEYMVIDTNQDGDIRCRPFG
jgi:hypothetical protein